MNGKKTAVAKVKPIWGPADSAEAAELEYLNRCVARRLDRQAELRQWEAEQVQAERLRQELAGCRTELREERQDRAREKELQGRMAVSIVGLVTAIGCIIVGVPVLGLGPAVMAAWV